MATDPRVAEALARAAHTLALSPSYVESEIALQYLAGWRDAVQALSEEHLGHYEQYDCTGCKAIAKFITAMLGGSDD